MDTGTTQWHVYVIQCSDSSFYTGITTDVERRFADHAGKRGAKYFRLHTPEKLVYVESGHSRSSAGKREIEIKRLTRAEKIRLILQQPPLTMRFCNKG
ncbi:GIY-YIG nuclease family protein [Geotalea sp. SG265]|uniref:GIY-YIG nuclease family protein n=1 Tax=Geotalea sp. SG265 TaxID=2922867 RepID=UPI001FAF4F04